METNLNQVPNTKTCSEEGASSSPRFGNDFAAQITSGGICRLVLDYSRYYIRHRRDCELFGNAQGMFPSPILSGSD